MIWTRVHLWAPALPDHCEPVNDFLFRFSSTFHVCVPSELAFISTTLGILSIAAWLSAQLPQIYKNYCLKSTSGLSVYFLLEWCLGDLGNLLGAIFTRQASWQITIGAYYVFVDFCLVLQWLWYERLKHGRPIFRVKSAEGRPSPGSADMHEVAVEGVHPPAAEPAHSDTHRTNPRPIFRTPTFDRAATGDLKEGSVATPRGTKVFRRAPSTSFPAPSPKTVVLIACLVALAQASPLTTSLAVSMQHDQASTPRSTPLERAGTVLSWMSTFLYVGSRFPQIFKNWSRKSTAGLSAHLFIAAFCGNLLYSSAIMTNPYAWHDFKPYGGGGWAGPAGSNRKEWVSAALPFFLGAAGVLVLDATVGMQFVAYGEDNSKLIVVEDARGRRWKWRRVSGWMRGWIPTVKEPNTSEDGRLLVQGDVTRDEGYGTLSERTA